MHGRVGLVHGGVGAQRAVAGDPDRVRPAAGRAGPEYWRLLLVEPADQLACICRSRPIPSSWPLQGSGWPSQAGTRGSRREGGLTRTTRPLIIGGDGAGQGHQTYRKGLDGYFLNVHRQIIVSRASRPARERSGSERKPEGRGDASGPSGPA